MADARFGFDVAFEEAIEFAKQRNVMLSPAFYSMAEELRSQAFTVTGIAVAQQIGHVLKTLVASTANGEAFDDWKAKIKKMPAMAALPPGRMEVIFRNAMQTHYNAGKWQQFQKMKAIRPYLMYSAIGDARTRPNHAALSGLIRPVDDPIWGSILPPLGHNCRCSVISLSQKQAEARSVGGNGLNKQIPEGAGPDKGWGGGVDGDCAMPILAPNSCAPTGGGGNPATSNGKMKHIASEAIKGLPPAISKKVEEIAEPQIAESRPPISPDERSLREAERQKEVKRLREAEEASRLRAERRQRERDAQEEIYKKAERRAAERREAESEIDDFFKKKTNQRRPIDEILKDLNPEDRDYFRKKAFDYGMNYRAVNGADIPEYRRFALDEFADNEDARFLFDARAIGGRNIRDEQWAKELRKAVMPDGNLFPFKQVYSIDDHFDIDVETFDFDVNNPKFRFEIKGKRNKRDAFYLSRAISRDGEIDNAYLVVEPEYRGFGFGQKINKRQREYLKTLPNGGVVNVLASLSVGGYNWANQGFDFASTADLKKYRREFRYFLQKNSINLSKEDMGSFKYPMHFARFDDGKKVVKKIKDPLPLSEAQIESGFLDPDTRAVPLKKTEIKWKESYRAMMSLGKAFMLGKTWYGVAKFGPGENKDLTDWAEEYAKIGNKVVGMMGEDYIKLMSENNRNDDPTVADDDAEFFMSSEDIEGEMIEAAAMGEMDAAYREFLKRTNPQLLDIMERASK